VKGGLKNIQRKILLQFIFGIVGDGRDRPKT